MQIHDKLVFEVYESVTEMDADKQKIVSLMEGYISLQVHLRVAVNEGKNRDEEY